MRSARMIIFSIASLFGLWLLGSACSERGEVIDLGVFGGGKGDFRSIDLEQLPPIPGTTVGDSTLELSFRGSGSFEVKLSQPRTNPASARALARLLVQQGDQVLQTASSTAPTLQWSATDADEHTYQLTIINRSYTKLLDGKLLVRATGGGNPGNDPLINVRFTAPACAEVPGRAPAGAHCYATSDEKEASRNAAGVVENIKQWIAQTRAVKQANPQREVVITMAFLTWNDWRIYDDICAATAAGVKFVGFFDASSAGQQPPKLAADAACRPENISIKYLGGKVDYQSDWRLMHIKMILFDTGEPRTRMIFGSANMSSYASSIHFENWVFAEVNSQSHFVQSHHCAVRALSADAYPDQFDTSSFPNVFEDVYDDCVAQITAAPDPQLQVFFTPDRETAARHAAVSLLNGASRSVDVAIQHFTNWSIADALAQSGRNPAVRTRLVVDDDTFYNEGETGGGDYQVWRDTLCFENSHSAQDRDPCDVGIDIRYMQTNGHLEYGKQYQHNKYILADDAAVFCGAGNFTEAAFGSRFELGNWSANYENFYLISLPAVAEQYRQHFERIHAIATAKSALPDSPAF